MPGGSPEEHDPTPAGLPEVVLARICAELGSNGDKVVAALRTAAHLIVLARNDDTGLRLAESAAYNLREAFDAVVDDYPAADGGYQAVHAAWLRYKLAMVGPDADGAAALREFHGVIERLAQKAENQAYQTRKLLSYVIEQTGVKPLPGDDDPTRRYSRLRGEAAATLHDTGTVSGVTALYDDTISWFIRFFTPPDLRVNKIVALARQPYTGPEQIKQLREFAYNQHHISLFLNELHDPAWLNPLHDNGLILSPTDGEPWPINFLISGAGGISHELIAELLERLLHETKTLEPGERQGFARDIIQTAMRLGPAGHSLATKILLTHPTDHWVQRMAVHIARDADPASDFVYTVADTVIGNGPRSDSGYYARVLLELIAAGLTRDNAPQRLKMVTAKIRRLSDPKQMQVVILDTAALGSPGGDLRDTVLILSQHLVGMIATWRELGFGADALLAMVKGIKGELGERIVCQALAGATEIDRADKISHLANRLASATATGDDLSLLADLGELTHPETVQLNVAFGPPSPAPEPDPETGTSLPHDWMRAWRWNLVLPKGVLVGWERAIAAVTAQHGDPHAMLLDTRIPRFLSGRPTSPYKSEELNELDPVDAATLVAAWRPGEDESWWGNTVWELASTLEQAIGENVAAWVADPVAIVTALREPSYIERYLRAVAAKAGETGAAMPRLMQAVRVILRERWEPARLSRSEIDPDVAWDSVNRAIIEAIGKLANQDADLAADLDVAWELTGYLLRALPEDLPGRAQFDDSGSHDDPYGRAINAPYGKALETVLWLAWWEHRHNGQTRPALASVLDEVLAVSGTVGAEFRSILATHRHVIEHIARPWIDERANDLFGGELGQITFDQTLAWGRPTRWFLSRYPKEMAAAAIRGVEHAVAWSLLGYLWEEPGYTIGSIIAGYKGDIEALNKAGEEIASLVQDIDRADPILARALDFWDGLLASDRTAVPAGALVGLGRWTFVGAVEGDAWFERMDRTLAITGGVIDMPIEIADRCKDAQPSERGLRMLRLMQGHGEGWERSHVAGVAVEALGAASGHGLGSELNRLRDRLLDLGRIDAKDIPPDP